MEIFGVRLDDMTGVIIILYIIIYAKASSYARVHYYYNMSVNAVAIGQMDKRLNVYECY